MVQLPAQEIFFQSYILQKNWYLHKLESGIEKCDGKVKVGRKSGKKSKSGMEKWDGKKSVQSRKEKKLSKHAENVLLLNTVYLAPSRPYKPFGPTLEILTLLKS